jgi:hypothetical protein
MLSKWFLPRQAGKSLWVNSLKVASLSPLKGTRGDTRTDLFTAGKTEESFSLKHVAARLLPPSGGPLGARVALLEVTGGVGKRAFSLSSLFFLVSGFTPRSQGGDGVGEGGVTPSRLRSSLRRFLCRRRRSKNHWFRLSRLIADPSWCFFVSKTHVQDALAKKGLNRPPGSNPHRPVEDDDVDRRQVEAR